MRNVFAEFMRDHQKDFGPVVRFNPIRDKLMSLDLSGNNTSLSDELIRNTGQFTHYINATLAGSGATYGIGGYGENRSVYGWSELFGKNEEEKRTIHLGTDIWGKPYTAVRAPIDGIVHSFGFNNGYGDYGVTVILSHQVNGFVFHTLYGHLSFNSIKNLFEGDRIAKGEIVGEFGIPIENGHWPPHLHFQTIIDLEDWKGDYPGVCRYSEKDKWLANCPDPENILQLNKHIVPTEVYA